MKNRSLPYLILLSMVLMIFGILARAPTASGGALDAKLDKVVLTPTPNVVGIGGEVTLDAAVYIYGGCCYHLWAYDVVPELVIPGDVQLISGPTPKEYGEVDGIPGGEPVIVHFSWKIRSMVVGYHPMNITINTENCGSASSNCTLRVVRGCAISEPVEYQASSGETVITVFADSYIEGVEVAGVGLHYVKYNEAPKEDSTDLKADNDTLIMGGTVEIGKKVDVNPIEYRDDYWRGSISTSDEVSTIYYWIVATDNNGENTTSPVYRLDVVDEEKRDNVVSTTFWSLILGSIIGILAIVIIYLRLRSTLPGAGATKGFLVLGMTRDPGIIKDLERTSVDAAYQHKLRNWRLIIGGIVVVAGIILLVWSISTGQLEALITHIDEGK